MKLQYFCSLNHKTTAVVKTMTTAALVQTKNKKKQNKIVAIDGLPALVSYTQYVLITFFWLRG